MLDWSNCKSENMSGNVFNLNKLKSTSFKVATTSENLNHFCKPTAFGNKIMMIRGTFPNSVKLCKKFKSSLSHSYDSVQKTLGLEGNYSALRYLDFIWASFTDTYQQGDFRSIQTNTELNATHLVWLLGEPNGDVLEDCTAFINVYTNKIVDLPCKHEAFPICNFEEKVIFQIWGLDLDDEHFILDMEDSVTFEKYGFSGYFGSSIVKTLNSSIWSIRTKEGIDLYTFAEDHTPIGTWNWVPSRNTSEKVRLSFNACNETEFSCDDGTCISKWMRCNNFIDCEDFSDEESCTFLKLPTGYKNTIAPSSANEEPTHLDITTNIKQVYSMDVSSMLIKLSFSIRTQWQDKRVEFLNLKPGKLYNHMASDEWKRLWIPNYHFLNTLHGDMTVELDEEPKTRMAFNLRTNQSLPRLSKDVKQNFRYAAEHVIIDKGNFYTVEFICPFDWANYPFDTQICPIIFQAVHEGFEIIEYNVSSQIEIFAYSTFSLDISSTKVVDFHTKKGNCVEILLKFERNAIPILLKTFLPTVILTLISHLTNHFMGQDMFEAIITINATVLMTLTSLFISTVDSLPNTIYIKLIDIWMIVCFIYPFCIIMIHTFVHVVTRTNTKFVSKVNKILSINCFQVIIMHIFSGCCRTDCDYLSLHRKIWLTLGIHDVCWNLLYLWPNTNLKF